MTAGAERPAVAGGPEEPKVRAATGGGDRWRLLVHPPARAAWNMAVDEAVATAVGAGRAPATLRLYAWEPAAVSIGYFQGLDAEVDLDACRERGIEWVRRPTGGRAVLHDRELTYALMARRSGGVREIYAHWSRGLIAGLNLLEVAAEWAAPTRGFSSACFDACSLYEVAVAGRKLVGSAQTRRWGAVLQHGSIPLSLDRAVHGVVFRGQRSLAEALAARACALDEVRWPTPTWHEVARALVAGFGAALGIELAAGELSPEELQLAAALARDKYGTDGWNARCSPAGGAS